MQNSTSDTFVYNGNETPQPEPQPEPEPEVEEVNTGDINRLIN